MVFSAYRQVENNIIKSWLFIIIFALTIVFLGWLFSYLFDLKFLLFLAIIFAFLEGFLGYFYSDQIILSSVKAKPLLKEEGREVYNIIENLTIASGLKMPKVYFLDDYSINAFATGRNPEKGVICLTKGAIEKLEKTELEGVIAHELSHIKNNDIFLFSVIAIMASAIGYLSYWFLRINYFPKKDEREGNNLFFLIGFLIALLAPLFITLLKLAISRKREFLADASGVLITRYPKGLINALRKIELENQITKIPNPAFSHLFISDPFRKRKNWFLNLWSTHPPIEERIKALEKMETDLI